MSIDLESVKPSPDMSGIKDSGEKESFSTGSVRDKQAGKGAFHLVPTWVLWLVSRVYEGGAIKYAPRNWEKGQPLSQYIKSAENHIAKHKMGLRDEPHISQAIWNLLGYIFTAVLIKLGRRPGSLSDMPDQLHCVPGTIAEPLSNFEYASMNTFFQGAEFIQIPEEGKHLSIEEEAGKQRGDEPFDQFPIGKQPADLLGNKLPLTSEEPFVSIRKAAAELERATPGFHSEYENGKLVREKSR